MAISLGIYFIFIAPPIPNVRVKVEGALQEAFRAYGFYGLPDHDLTELAPVFL